MEQKEIDVGMIKHQAMLKPSKTKKPVEKEEEQEDGERNRSL